MTNPNTNTTQNFDPTKPDFTDRYLASERMADYYKAGSVVPLGNFDMTDYVRGGTTVLSDGGGVARVVPSRGYAELNKAFDTAEDLFGKEFVSYGDPFDYEKDEVHAYDSDERPETVLQGLYVTKEALDKAAQEGKVNPFAERPRIELPKPQSGILGKLALRR